MREPFFIPPRTRAELNYPAPRGQRHEQAKKIAVSMIGNGFASEAVFAQLRSMYEQDVNDREINALITWAISKNPSPCGTERRRVEVPYRAAIKPQKPITSGEAIANTEAWLRSFRSNECDLWHTSPWRPLEDWKLDSLMLLAALYGKDEFVNIVADFTIEQKDGEGKANPKGAGQTLLRDEWMRQIRDHGAPQSDAGAWVRPNPVKQNGSGKAGAITDDDVTSYRFTILESDLLPAELALSLWARLPLPVAAIVGSGGKSAHAWIKVDCADPAQYDEKVKLIYSRLARFGVDQSNKNASRLSRLPGVRREIGKQGNGEQRLFYLNSDPTEAPIFERRD